MAEIFLLYLINIDIRFGNIMDLTRIKHLAGITESQLDEIVDTTELVDLDDVQRRLTHCKKALSIANTLPDPADRKKWKGAALSNLNRVRAALNRIAKQIEQDNI
jgi:hypothetical protein